MSPAVSTFNPRILYVYSHDKSQSEPLLMGELRVSRVRGQEVFSFEYDQGFLDSPFVFNIDPDLGLFRGPQYVGGDKRNFGLFMDSAPDRWGRTLLDRREAIQARMEERSQRKLMESDYLLQVHDASRMGALRFKLDRNGPFLDDDHTLSTPPMTSLRELEHAVVELEREVSLQDKAWLARFALLIAPGSSLGGARPKASVEDESGTLWIAKFPSGRDEIDTGAWEFVAYVLARRCGVEMAPSHAQTFFSHRHTFLTKRFDRDDSGARHHFFSAMTLLGYQDGADAQTGVSYLELAELILSKGIQPDEDLEQLWRRIVFSVCISNTDDHLRNHGFLISGKGIKLSPAYDINPNPTSYGLHLNIDAQDNRQSFELLLSVAGYFRLSKTRAADILSEVQKAVGQWRDVARSLNLSRSEMERMSPAFEAAE